MFNKLTKSSPRNGIQTNIKKIEKPPKRSSMIFVKLMMFFPTEIEDLTMMIIIIDNTQMKMLTEHLNDSLNNMAHKNRTRKNSLNNTSPTEEEAIIKSLEFQEMPEWNKSIMLIENLLFNTILKTTQERKMNIEKNSMKSMKLTIIFQMDIADIITI